MVEIVYPKSVGGDGAAILPQFLAVTMLKVSEAVLLPKGPVPVMVTA